MKSIKQVSYWDCGVACACSVLKYFQNDITLSKTKKVLVTTSPNGVWTIELAYLFSKFNLGARPSHASLDFYQNENFDNVNQLFQNASSHNIEASLRSLSQQEFKELIQIYGFAIVCCESKKLFCEKCTNGPCNVDNKYMGHYILVTSYSDEFVEYMDPAPTACKSLFS